jgi:uncharacterized protein
LAEKLLAMKPRDLSREECERLLSSARVGRLGLSSDNMPYVIPMSYVYSDGKIYLHSRPGGKKVEVAGQNPQVCFEVDILEEGRWSSVLSIGTAKLSSDAGAKRRMFDVFTEKGMGGHGGKPFQREAMEKMPMLIWEIDIQEITGRQGIW